jgi:hypothetical protein
VNFYIDYIPDTLSGKNIFIVVEPALITPNIKEYLVHNYFKFNYILTYDKDLLKLPNAHMYVYGTTWIDKEDYTGIESTQKQFHLSGLFGWKNWTAGHHLRHEVYHNQSTIAGIPFTFYRSSQGTLLEAQDNPIIGKELKDKIALFRTSMFSVVIENSQQENYISESLIDCLITKTVPVYFGCPNINQYFDTTGWSIVTTKDDVFKKVSELTPELYKENIKTIEHNYKIAIQYSDLYTNINRVISNFKEFRSACVEISDRVITFDATKSDNTTLFVNKIYVVSVGRVASTSFSQAFKFDVAHTHYLDILRTILTRSNQLIITGIRQPHTRRTSLAFHYMNHFHKNQPYIYDDMINLVKYGGEAKGFFNIWFDDFFEQTKIDFMNFDPEKGYSLLRAHNNNYVLLYMFEKLDKIAPTLCRFLNIDTLPNIGDTNAHSREMYDKVKREAWSSTEISELHNTPFLQYVYKV